MRDPKRPASRQRRWLPALAILGVGGAFIAIGLYGVAQRSGPASKADQAVVADRGSPPPSTTTGESPADMEAVIVGTVVEVIDGDTLEVQLSSGSIRVRMESIDAPEHDQPMGDAATQALARRVRGREVALEPMAQDQYDRMVAYVYLGNENVGLWLVDQGYAWAYHRHLHDRSYCDAEFRARAAQRGIWALPEKERRIPYEWRAHKQKGVAVRWSKHDDDTLEQCYAAVGRHENTSSGEGKRGASAHTSAAAPATLVGRSANADPGQCRIKGNINGKGQKIYHVPGSLNYERTQINEAAGERWFCTEEEARAAGWQGPQG